MHKELLMLPRSDEQHPSKPVCSNKAIAANDDLPVHYLHAIQPSDALLRIFNA